ncbi:MAG TPA: adenylate/guanylate cyclase domain-containing protein [Acidimicrobiales bacterium]|nr:adenylate/guanylate cyclase domain-containing protein [Acidimicrobiales bacterium]
MLFTDIVGSTSFAATIGDSRWRDLLDEHDALARSRITEHRGRLVGFTGDGVLAHFAATERAIRCAFALREALSVLGIEIRAGLHVGEIDLRGEAISGIAFHIAHRVLRLAQPGELLASEAVPCSVRGGGVAFRDAGEHELKGVPGRWRLLAVGVPFDVRSAVHSLSA